MWRDEKYLLDMLLAAHDAREFAANLTHRSLADSRLHQRAIVNALQTVGEAARHVSQEMRAAHPEIDWPKIVGMRNRLVHDYSNIDLDTVWDVLDHHVPALIAALTPLVPPEPEGWSDPSR